jgi:hypothetical protein
VAGRSDRIGNTIETVLDARRRHDVWTGKSCRIFRPRNSFTGTAGLHYFVSKAGNNRVPLCRLPEMFLVSCISLVGVVSMSTWKTGSTILKLRFVYSLDGERDAFRIFASDDTSIPGPKSGNCDYPSNFSVR